MLFKLIYANKSKRVHKSFSFSLPVYQLNCLRTSKGLSLGSWYVSNVSTFPNAFPLVLDSNLHDLNETNPGLILFVAELPWCCFCAEIKVLGMERNFARIFYINKENFRSQGVTTATPIVTTTISLLSLLPLLLLLSLLSKLSYYFATDHLLQIINLQVWLNWQLSC